MNLVARAGNFEEVRMQRGISSSSQTLETDSVTFFTPKCRLRSKQGSLNENREKSRTKKKYEEESHFLAGALCLLGYCLMLVIGYIGMTFFPPAIATDKKKKKGFPPLVRTAEHLFVHYYIRRARDVLFRPLCGSSGLHIEIKDRVSDDYNWTLRFSGTKTKCMNIGGFNYLGFSETKGPNIEACASAIKEYGVSTCSSYTQYGVSTSQIELEALMAKFLGVEDVAVFGIGFATNALNFPSMITEKSLILSDERIHASLVLSIRLAKNSCVIFKHNDPDDLEKKIRGGIIRGQPETGEAWKKIFVVVEGIYSMDGTIACLPEIISLKRKYKFYLYVDEAHSMGVIGPRGRGITDYHGVDPKKVDMLMGTFSKSFGANGGYIAGSKDTIEQLRRRSHASHYAATMSPPLAKYIIGVLKVMMNPNHPSSGIKRVQQLNINTVYFRKRLSQLGLVVYGHPDSPVIPVIIFSISKLRSLSNVFLRKNVAIVVVAYPATPFTSSRIRFCLSAHHTKEHLDKVLGIIDQLADEYGLRHSKKSRSTESISYDDLQIEFPK